ncbi:hypothetical protein QJQ45_004462 [Haematococcus lacustris]|nr:hypothetical protein QJQ45_004462 [Haematococcus lacustris]
MTKISSRLLYRSKQRGFLELDLLVGLWAEKEIPAMNLPMLQDLAVMLDQALRKHVAQQLGSNSQQKSHASQGVEWVRGWDDAWRWEGSGGLCRGGHGSRGVRAVMMGWTWRLGAKMGTHWHTLYGYKEMAELSMKRHNRAKQLVVFFGAASIGTRGEWGADAVLRSCCKVVCRPRGQDQDGGRVVLVDEHRTSRVSSAVNGKQPCEVELNTLMAPRRPPQAPRSSQEATQPAASEPGPSTPQPAKGSKRTKAEPAAEPTKGKARGKAVKGLQITQPLPFNRGNMRRKERIVTLPWSYTVPS